MAEAKPEQITARFVAAVAHDVAPKAFVKKAGAGRAVKPGRGSVATEGDLVRRSEVIDEIDEWERRNKERLGKMKPAEVVSAIRDLIRAL